MSIGLGANLPPAFLARLQALRQMAQGGLPVQAPSPAPSAPVPMLPQTGGQDVNLPFPDMPQQAPPGHPAHGMLDQTALNILGLPQVPISPYQSGGQQFLQSLIQSTAHSWAGQRAQPILQNQQFMDEQRQNLAEQNKANIAAKLFASNEATKAKDTEPKEPKSLLPLISPDTGEGVKDASGKPVMVRPELANFYRELYATKSARDAAAKAAGAKVAGEGLTADDLNIKESPWGTYINVGDYQPKQQLDARRLAKKAGVRVLDKDESGTLGNIQDFDTSLDQLLSGTQRFLAPNASGRPMAFARNKLAVATQSDPEVAAYANFPTLVAIPLLKGLGGKGSGFRMTQVEINNAIKNLPNLGDDYPAAQAKVSQLHMIIGQAARRYFGTSATKPATSWFDGKLPK